MLVDGYFYLYYYLKFDINEDLLLIVLKVMGVCVVDYLKGENN